MKGCQPLNDDEISGVYKALSASPRDRALFCVGVSTGFRVSELLSLRVGNVWQYGRVVDRVTVERKNTKGKVAGRTAALNPTAQQAIAAWIDELQHHGTLQPDTYLFLSRKGDNRPISRQQVAKVLHAAFAVCEITGKTGTHTMRKTCAQRAYTRFSGDMLKVQRVLGHVNLNNTMLYLGVDDREILEAMGAFDLPVDVVNVG